MKEPQDEAIEKIAPFTKDNVEIDGVPTAYVCQGWNCDVPTTDPRSLEDSLKIR